MAAVLCAMGCKNTFTRSCRRNSVLRMYADGTSWVAGLRRHGLRALLLSLTLALPIGHYAYFRLHWHPGQYPPTSVTVEQLGRMLAHSAGR